MASRPVDKEYLDALAAELAVRMAVGVRATPTAIGVSSSDAPIRIRVVHDRLTAEAARDQSVAFAVGVPFGQISQHVDSAASPRIYRDVLGGADPRVWIEAHAGLVNRLDLQPDDQLLVSLNEVVVTWEPRGVAGDADLIQAFADILLSLPKTQPAVDRPELPARLLILEPVSQWAVADDIARSSLVSKASDQDLQGIVAAIRPRLDDINRELDGRQLSPTQESTLHALGQLWHEASAELAQRGFLSEAEAD